MQAKWLHKERGHREKVCFNQEYLDKVKITNLDRIYRRCLRQDNPKNAPQSLEDTAAVAPGPFHRAWSRVCAGMSASAKDAASVDVAGGPAPVQRMAQPPGAEQRRLRHLQLVTRAGRADRRQQWHWTTDCTDAGETRRHRCSSGHPTTPGDGPG